MKARENTKEEDQIILHPTIVECLAKRATNFENLTDRKLQIKLNIKRFKIKKAAEYLNEQTVKTYLEILDDEAVKMFLMQRKYSSSIFVTLAKSTASLGKELTIAIIKAMEEDKCKNLHAKPTDIFDRLISFTMYEKEDVKDEIVQLMLDAEKRKFILRNWVDISSLELLDFQLSYLRQYETELIVLAENGILSARDIRIMSHYGPSPKDAPILKQLSSYPMITLARFYSTREHYDGLRFFDACRDKQSELQKLINYFSNINIEILEYLFNHAFVEKYIELKFSFNNFENSNFRRRNDRVALLVNGNFFNELNYLKNDSTWHAWMRAASSLSIKKAFERNPNLTTHIITGIRLLYEEKKDDAYLIQALSTLLLFSESTSLEIRTMIDDFISQSLYLDGFKSFCHYDRENAYPIIYAMAQFIADYRICYLLEKKLIDFSHLSELACQPGLTIDNNTVDAFIRKHRYVILKALNEEVSKSEWDDLGFAKIAKPDGIRRLKSKMSNFPPSPNEYVDQLFLKVFVILEEKQKSCDRRHPKVTKLYVGQYDLFFKWHPNSMRAQNALNRSKMEVRKATRILAQAARQRDLFFSVSNLNEPSNIMLPDELLHRIALETRGSLAISQAEELINNNFSKPPIPKK